MLKFILIILDGFGLRNEKNGNAVAQAQTPTLDDLIKNNPVSSIETSGKFVGLPDGVMGNSEVGHMSLGAGRVIKQDLVRINESIELNKLKDNINLNNLFKSITDNNTLHIIGLVSDGGVHSHINHFKHIISLARKKKIKNISIHAISDGRDTSPESGIDFIRDLDNYIKSDDFYSINSISGRFYAMDRDNRWERIEKAYRTFIFGEGENYKDVNSAIKEAYSNSITDEFIVPCTIGTLNPTQNGDSVLMINYRADRMREIVSALNDKNFKKFNTKLLDLNFYSMTKYHDDFLFPVLFDKQIISNIFPEILSNNNYKQLRIAETEKYAHVTYFFNGGREDAFIGESRILVPSPNVTTYDLKPEMSALEVTKHVVSAIESNNYEAIIVNFANPDMVGHTGNINAAVKAMEVVDSCLGEIRKSVKNKSSTLFLTADHGNLEMMINSKTGKIHTAHTKLPVPLIMESVNKKYSLHKTGKLADVAPTILDYLNIPKPLDMDGKSLLKSNNV